MSERSEDPALAGRGAKGAALQPPATPWPLELATAVAISNLRQCGPTTLAVLEAAASSERFFLSASPSEKGGPPFAEYAPPAMILFLKGCLPGWPGGADPPKAALHPKHTIRRSNRKSTPPSLPSQNSARAIHLWTSVDTCGLPVYIDKQNRCSIQSSHGETPFQEQISIYPSRPPVPAKRGCNARALSLLAQPRPAPCSGNRQSATETPSC